MLSDNGSQMVGASRKLREMVKGVDVNQLRKYCGEKGIQGYLTTTASPHEDGCAEVLFKCCKNSSKRAIGEHVLSPFELYTCLLEIANLINQRPIGRIPGNQDDGAYLSSCF